MPGDQASNHGALGAACRTLHLAFKGMDTDEVYDQLMMCMVKAIKQYDPYYSDKVKSTVVVLEGALRNQKKFTAADVTKILGFDAVRYIRILVKRGYLIGGLAAV